MSNNSYTNYTIVDPTTKKPLLDSIIGSRAKARKVLASVKAEGIPAKIQANEYQLKSVRFIR